MPGPPPKDPSQRRRRNLPPELVRLPAEGRQGPPPAWPLQGRRVKGETELWRHLWATPQAVAWETLGPIVIRSVARYAPLLCTWLAAADRRIHRAKVISCWYAAALLVNRTSLGGDPTCIVRTWHGPPSGMERGVNRERRPRFTPIDNVTRPASSLVPASTGGRCWSDDARRPQS